MLLYTLRYWGRSLATKLLASHSAPAQLVVQIRRGAGPARSRYFGPFLLRGALLLLVYLAFSWTQTAKTG